MFQILDLTYQRCTELLKVKHFILVLFCQFFAQNNCFFPHLLRTQTLRELINYNH